MTEAWPFVFEGRIFSTPIITPGLLDGPRQLEWLLDRGAPS